jgi:hypothetical protein
MYNGNPCLISGRCRRRRGRLSVTSGEWYCNWAKRLFFFKSFSMEGSRYARDTRTGISPSVDLALIKLRLRSPRDPFSCGATLSSDFTSFEELVGR